MVFIKHSILKCELIGLNAPLRQIIKKELSYEDKNHMIARAVAKKRLGYLPRRLSWSGIVYLLTEKNEFPSGLLNRVLNILDAYKEPYEFLLKKDIPNGTSLTLKNSIDLWPHQRAAIDAIKKNITGIIRVGTGGGKAILSVVACAEIGQLPYLIIVNRISLLNQLYKDYTKFFDEKIGYIGDGTIDVQRINVATIGTLCSMLKIKLDEKDEENLNYSKEQIQAVKALLSMTKMVVVDECHHGSSSTYKTILGALPRAYYRIGLSATPITTNETDILLEAAFGPIIYSKSASELIQEGILAKPTIYMVQYNDSIMSKTYPANAKPIPNYQKVYKDCIVENDIFNTIIAECAVVNANLNRLTLVSVKQINHGENILAILKRIAPNINSEFLNGKNKVILNESKIKQDFTNGKIKILISTLFDEGVDIPKIDAIIDAGGGKSPIKALQLVGRSVRKYPGKTKSFVYTFIHPYAHLYEHSIARYEILKTEEEFNIKVINWNKNS